MKKTNRDKSEVREKDYTVLKQALIKANILPSFHDGFIQFPLEFLDRVDQMITVNNISDLDNLISGLAENTTGRLGIYVFVQEEGNSDRDIVHLLGVPGGSFLVDKLNDESDLGKHADTILQMTMDHHQAFFKTHQPISPQVYHPDRSGTFIVFPNEYSVMVYLHNLKLEMCSAYHRVH